MIQLFSVSRSTKFWSDVVVRREPSQTVTASSYRTCSARQVLPCVCRRACAVTDNREVPRIGKQRQLRCSVPHQTKLGPSVTAAGHGNEPFTPPISIAALPLLSILIDATSTPAPQLGAECCGAPRFRHRRGLPSASSSGAPLLHSTTSTSETLDEHMAGQFTGSCSGLPG